MVREKGSGCCDLPIGGAIKLGVEQHGRSEVAVDAVESCVEVGAPFKMLNVGVVRLMQLREHGKPIVVVVLMWLPIPTKLLRVHVEPVGGGGVAVEVTEDEDGVGVNLLFDVVVDVVIGLLSLLVVESRIDMKINDD